MNNSNAVANNICEAAKELKQMLDKINEIDDGFPFETMIKRTSFGQGKTKYSFT